MGTYRYCRILVAVDNKGKVVETQAIPIMLTTEKIGDTPRVVYPEHYEERKEAFYRKYSTNYRVQEGLADSVANFLLSFPEVTDPSGDDSPKEARGPSRRSRARTKD